MKKNEQAAKNLTKLMGSLKKKYKNAQEPHALAPITQLVLSMLQWNSHTQAADEAFDKLMGSVVDYNELRVTHLGELVDIIGSTYPQSQERLERLLETLHEIYQREHKTDLASLKGKAKKEIKAYLETLPGITPYTIAQITLICFSGHAIPVDNHLASLLIENEIADEEATVAQIETFLEKQIKSAEGLEAHTLLRAWADDHPIKKPKTKRKASTAKKAKTTKKAAAKKATTTTKKKAAKKTAKKAAKKVAKKSKSTKAKKSK